MISDVISANDLDLARRIHRSLLPQRLVTDQFDVDLRYREMQILGGDYGTVYHQKSSDRIFQCVCDVTGHGLAATLLAGRVNSFVLHEVAVAEHPCQVVENLNSFIFKHFNGLGIFATFFCLEIDLSRREISYAGCAHPPALLYCPGEKHCQRLESHHELIGLSPTFSEECRIDLISFSPGDRLLLYTDGILETRNPGGDFFGVEGIESILKTSTESEDSGQLLDRLFNALDGFRYGEPRDDALTMATRFL